MPRDTGPGAMVGAEGNEVRWIEEAKKSDTRSGRVARTVASLARDEGTG